MSVAAVKNLPTVIRNAMMPSRLAAQAGLFPTPVQARDQAAKEYLQCVPFARQISGIQIYGDAHLWWDKADGRYQRGSDPVEGAVLSLPGHGSMRLGHIAVVQKIVDDRNILISHANWSPINGRRGQIERRVAARDVSKKGEWSRVRINYAPIGKLGTTAFPVKGFIYPKAAKKGPKRHWAAAKSQPQARAPDQRQWAHSRTDKPQEPTESVDLVGDLLDRLGS